MSRTAALLLPLLLVACDARESVPEGDALQAQSAGFERAAVPKATEPSFNGGFETRAKGTCTARPPPETIACDWPVGMPTGWRIQLPHRLGYGIYAQYGTGRNPAPPLPDRTVPDSTSIMVGPCVPGMVNPSGTSCTEQYVLLTSLFPIVSGADYRLSLWVRSTHWFREVSGQHHGITLRVAWFDAAQQWIQTVPHYVTPDNVPVAAWTQDGFDVSAPANAALALVELVIDPTGERFVFIDDVRLEPR